MFRTCRRVGYAMLALNGLLHVLAPRVTLRLAARAWLLGYENADDLEPRDWLATTNRVAGVGMIAVGITGLLIDRDDPEVDALVESDDAESVGTDES